MSLLSKTFIVPLVIILAVCILFSFNAACIILSLCLVYRVFKRTVTLPIFNSVIIRALVAFILYVVILQIVILCSWLISHEFPLDKTVPLTTLLLLVLTGISSYFFKEKAVSTKELFFRRDDGISLGIALVLIALIIVPTLRHDSHLTLGNVIPRTLIGYMDLGIDDTNHYGMVLDHLQLNRGIIAHTKDASAVSSPQIFSYPLGWHSANALLISAFKATPSTTDVMIGYVLTKLIWFLIMVFLFVRFTLLLYRKNVLAKTQNWLTTTWVTAASLFFSYYVLLEQFKEGFYSFIPELIFILLLGFLLIQFADDKADAKKRYRALFPSILVITGSILSWFLVLPAVCLAVLFPIILPMAKNRKLEQKLLLAELKTTWPTILLAIIAILIQVKFTAGGQSFTAAIDNPGSITEHSWQYFAVAILGAAMFFRFTTKKTAAYVENLGILIMLLLGFSGFIYLFQYLTVGHSDYYFTKTLNTVMILVIPITIAAGAFAVGSVQPRTSAIVACIFAGTLLITTVLVVGVQPLNTSNIDYVKGHRTFTNDQNAYIYNDIAARTKVQPLERHNVTLYYTPGQIGYSVIGSSIAKTANTYNNCYSMVAASLYSANPSDLFTMIRNKCKDLIGNVKIITMPDNVTELQKQLDNTGLDHLKFSIGSIQ